MSNTLATRSRAQTAFLKDLHNKYGKKYTEDADLAPPREGTITAKEIYARERRAKRMEAHYKRMFNKQIKVVNRHNERGVKIEWPTTAPKTPPPFASTKNEPQIRSSRAKKDESAQKELAGEKSVTELRLLFNQRKQQLSEKIQRHFGYPNGPLDMVQGLSKKEQDDENSAEQRKTNKIHIEEMVQLKRQDLETSYLDATLEMIKFRGSDYGLNLSNFVQNQLKTEQRQLIANEIDLGLMTMKMIRERPNENMRRYWKEKIAQIKIYIKAHKYDIKIPQPLQFEDSEDEMMNEVKLQVQAKQKKEAEARKIPKANDNITRKGPSIKQALNNEASATASFERLTPSHSSVKRNLSNIAAESPKYGGANPSVRPATATAMTRLRKATSISAHRHFWRRKPDDQTLNSSSQVDNSIVLQDDQQQTSAGCLKVSGFAKSIENRKMTKKRTRAIHLTSSVPSLHAPLETPTNGQLNMDLNEALPSLPSSQFIIGGDKDVQGWHPTGLLLAAQNESQRQKFQQSEDPMRVSQNSTFSMMTPLQSVAVQGKSALIDVSTLPIKAIQPVDDGLINCAGSLQLPQPQIMPVSSFKELTELSYNDSKQNLVATGSKAYLKLGEQKKTLKNVISTVMGSPARQVTQSSGKNSMSSSQINLNRKSLAQQKYEVLPITSMPFDDEIERPYRSFNRVPSAQESRILKQQSSANKLATCLAAQQLNIQAAENHNYADQLLQTASNSTTSSKDVLLRLPDHHQSHSLLNHPDQIQIQTQAKPDVSEQQPSKTGSSQLKNTQLVDQEKMAQKRREEFNNRRNPKHYEEVVSTQFRLPQGQGKPPVELISLPESLHGSPAKFNNSTAEICSKSDHLIQWNHSSVDLSAGMDYYYQNPRASIQSKDRTGFIASERKSKNHGSQQSSLGASPERKIGPQRSSGVGMKQAATINRDLPFAQQRPDMAQKASGPRLHFDKKSKRGGGRSKVQTRANESKIDRQVIQQQLALSDEERQSEHQINIETRNQRMLDLRPPPDRSEYLHTQYATDTRNQGSVKNVNSEDTLYINRQGGQASLKTQTFMNAVESSTKPVMGTGLQIYDARSLGSSESSQPGHKQRKHKYSGHPQRPVSTLVRESKKLTPDDLAQGRHLQHYIVHSTASSKDRRQPRAKYHLATNAAQNDQNRSRSSNHSNNLGRQKSDQQRIKVFSRASVLDPRLTDSERQRYKSANNDYASLDDHIASQNAQNRLRRESNGSRRERQNERNNHRTFLSLKEVTDTMRRSSSRKNVTESERRQIEKFHQKQSQPTYRSQETFDAVALRNQNISASTDAVMNMCENQVGTPKITHAYSAEQSMEKQSAKVVQNHKEMRGSFEAMPNRGSPVNQSSQNILQQQQQSGKSGVNMYDKNYIRDSKDLTQQRKLLQPEIAAVRKNQSHDLRLKVTVIPSNRKASHKQTRALSIFDKPKDMRDSASIDGQSPARNVYRKDLRSIHGNAHMSRSSGRDNLSSNRHSRKSHRAAIAPRSTTRGNKKRAMKVKQGAEISRRHQNDSTLKINRRRSSDQTQHLNSESDRVNQSSQKDIVDRASNGRGSNGRGSNGRGSNGRGSNGRGSNGRGSNGRGSNGRGSNGRGSNSRQQSSLDQKEGQWNRETMHSSPSETAKQFLKNQDKSSALINQIARGQAMIGGSHSFVKSGPKAYGRAGRRLVRKATANKKDRAEISQQNYKFLSDWQKQAHYGKKKKSDAIKKKLHTETTFNLEHNMQKKKHLANEPTDMSFNTVSRINSAHPRQSSLRTSYKASGRDQLKYGGLKSLAGRVTQTGLSNDSGLSYANQPVSVSILSIANRSSLNMQAISGSKLASLRPVNICSAYQKHKQGHSYYTHLEASRLQNSSENPKNMNPDESLASNYNESTSRQKRYRQKPLTIMVDQRLKQSQRTSLSHSNAMTSESIRDDTTKENNRIYATIDTNIYGDNATKDSLTAPNVDSLQKLTIQQRNGTQSCSPLPFWQQIIPVGASSTHITTTINKRKSIPQNDQSVPKFTTLHINTLSMEKSLQVESEKQVQRERQSIVSKQIKGGITKMGGFRRPCSSSVYQVKKGGLKYVQSEGFREDSSYKNQLTQSQNQLTPAQRSQKQFRRKFMPAKQGDQSVNAAFANLSARSFHQESEYAGVILEQQNRGSEQAKNPAATAAAAAPPIDSI